MPGFLLSTFMLSHVSTVTQCHARFLKIANVLIRQNNRVELAQKTWLNMAEIRHSGYLCILGSLEKGVMDWKSFERF